ncbi:MAG: hypothetical protein PHD01_09555 [Geobacteraceae bacterium]|nr:hypothetical protein [Geobacteraceae bacterium]
MLEPILLSLKVASAAVTVDFFVGLGIVRTLARKEFPGKNVVES